jgi:tRNA(Ile)-lysidine synthetase-like protein
MSNNVLEEKLKKVLHFWFPNGDRYEEFWFNGEKDEEIYQLFGDFFHEITNGLTTDNFTQHEDPEVLLAYIILLDQCSRNLARIDPSIDYKKYDTISLQIAEHMLSETFDLTFPLSHRIFILLPLRHVAKSKNDSRYLYNVLAKVKEYQTELGSSVMLTRFRNATLASFTELTDGIVLYDNESEFHESDVVLDPMCKNRFKNRFEDSPELAIFADRLTNFITKNRLRNLAVSLSGGVDSMTLLFVLTYLRKKGLINDIYAMHLEYCNRPESPIETRVIANYCKQLDVAFYVRKIDYMTRDSVDRDFYEKTTKEVRFATYRYLSESHQIDGWCLGHISDDVSENVAMNIFAGRDLLDLIVMNPVSFIDGVTILRPFLDTKKSDIYKLASLYSLPYMKDTTPDWSSRGVLRRKVTPALQSHWPTVMDTLVSVGEQSRQWKNVVEKFVMDPIKREITKRDDGVIVFPVKPEYTHLPLVIWTTIFLHIFHTMLGVKMISHKNVEYFAKMLSNNLSKCNRFHFSNKCIGIFTNNFLLVCK